MASRNLKSVDQGELPLTRKAEPNSVPVELIRRQKNAAAAFALACQSSGLEDKEIFGGLGLDAGYFSRIKAGTATLQDDKRVPFCEIVGNSIYPEWLAYQMGCTLVRIQTESERLLAKALEALAESKAREEMLTTLLTRRVA